MTNRNRKLHILSVMRNRITDYAALAGNSISPNRIFLAFLPVMNYLPPTITLPYLTNYTIN